MSSFELFVIARIFHIFSIVIWIGGVSFVTLVLLPELIRQKDINKRYELFEIFENRFGKIAKLMVILAGISGLYMFEYLHAWNRFTNVRFWWLHLMTLIWLIFAIVLFILEPLYFHAKFRELALIESEKTFKTLKWMHYIILTLSLMAVIGGVGGVHGLF